MKKLITAFLFCASITVVYGCNIDICHKACTGDKNNILTFIYECDKRCKTGPLKKSKQCLDACKNDPTYSKGDKGILVKYTGKHQCDYRPTTHDVYDKVDGSKAWEHGGALPFQCVCQVEHTQGRNLPKP